VVTGSGTRNAITYVATAKEPALRPYHWYKALVVAGAVEQGLPAAYVEWLRTCTSQPDPNATRRAQNELVLFGAEAQASANATERRG
jgi:gamma-glutamylcyclotransferase